MSAAHTKEDADCARRACDEIGDVLDLKDGIVSKERWGINEVVRRAVDLGAGDFMRLHAKIFRWGFSSLLLYLAMTVVALMISAFGFSFELLCSPQLLTFLVTQVAESERHFYFLSTHPSNI